MIEIYEMYEYRYCSDKPQVTIYRHTEPAISYELHINTDVPQSNRNPHLTLLLERHNSSVITGQAAFDWIKSRVWSPQYQQIQSVIRNAGLPAYDVWGLFKAANGRCTRDELQIVRTVNSS